MCKETNAMTVEGALDEVNLARKTCQLFRPEGPRIDCTFHEGLEPAIKDALGEWVRITGDGPVSGNGTTPTRLAIRDIEVVKGMSREDLPHRRGQPKVLTAAQVLRSGLVGVWKHRTDIPDSLTYARQLREQAWRRRE